VSKLTNKGCMDVAVSYISPEMQSSFMLCHFEAFFGTKVDDPSISNS